MRHFPLRATAASLVSLFVLSCGSGSGDGLGTPPPPPPITCPNESGNDPLYANQWHLKNTLTGGTGQDINVEPAWAGNTKGDGVRIAIVDDGLEIGHEDLCLNVVPGASYNYLDGSSDPSTVYSFPHDHGTSVAGVAAARDLNNRGVRGAAPHASLVGYNLLQAGTATNEADAMVRDAAANSISSNSWGAPDGAGTLAASNLTWRSAISTGLSTGRNGKGIVYVWAAGNGAPTDNSNYDGQANNRGVIAVGAVTHLGTKASYSEPGANLWVSAPAGEFCGTSKATTTVDRTGNNGFNYTGVSNELSNTNYTQCFNGTSSATPVVSGVVALMLQANPNLTWRDVRLILAETARQNDPTDLGWTTSATTGYHFNHKYGFGVVDAQAAVSRALTWTTNVAAEKTFTANATTGVPVAILDNNLTGVSSTITVTGSTISAIEFIEITFSAADHPYSGDLEITLTHNDTSTSSELALTHGCARNSTTTLADDCTPYDGWVFGSARHLGEAADGTWALTVKDRANFYTGTFQSWSLKFYGR